MKHRIATDSNKLRDVFTNESISSLCTNFSIGKHFA